MVRQAHHEAKPLKILDLILSLSKDEATTSCFFSILLGPIMSEAFLVCLRLFDPA